MKATKKDSSYSIKSGFLSGLMRVLDLGSTLDAGAIYEQSREVDLYALRQDWLAVGNDISLAIREFEKAHGL